MHEALHEFWLMLVCSWLNCDQLFSLSAFSSSYVKGQRSLWSSTPKRLHDVQEGRLSVSEGWPLQRQVGNLTNPLGKLFFSSFCFGLLKGETSYNKMTLTVSLFLSYSSRDYNSRDSRDYGPPPRDYSYRDYSSSRDDYGSMSRGYRYDYYQLSGLEVEYQPWNLEVSRGVPRPK